MIISRIFINLSVTLFIFYGLGFALKPALMAMLTTGLDVNTSSALVDIRSTYGGMMMGIGLCIFYAYKAVSRHAALMMIAIVLSLMAMTRGLGFALDGHGDALMYAYFLLEVGGTLLASALMRQEK